MLEEAEQKVREVEVALRSPSPAKQKVATLPSVVEGYLKDLRESLNRNPEKARGLLARLLGPITLRREDGKLIAEMKGNLPVLLEMDGEALYNPGSGGRI